MEIYLVGGAVRDELLGLPIKEKDWVVVNGSVNEMLMEGYRQVGKDFPVFLHPKTKEEYALARTERKVSRGYTGFTFHAGNDVTLEADLRRRDLTINAIAKRADGTLVDPYHGQKDLEKKLLRHVSSAFIEDPVRILRIARFAARFAELGFQVAPETMSLMKAMVHSGEVNALVAERVWKELERALQEKNPEAFFDTLEKCEALAVLFPHLGKEGLEALAKAKDLSVDAEVRFAALLYPLAFQDISFICERYRVPSSYREIALIVARRYKEYLGVRKLKADQVFNFFQATDAYRREERFIKMLEVFEAIAVVNNKEIQTQWVKDVFAASKGINAQEVIKTSKTGKDIGELIANRRVELIAKLIKKPNKK